VTRLTADHRQRKEAFREAVPSNRLSAVVSQLDPAIRQITRRCGLLDRPTDPIKIAPTGDSLNRRPALFNSSQLTKPQTRKKQTMQTQPTAVGEEAVFIFSLFIDGQTAREFAIMLNEWSCANKGRRLRVILNSGGGNISDGLFLYEEFLRLRRNGHHLTLAAYGRAASSAGWLLQAAANRVIGAQSWILIHEVSSKVEGTLTAIRNELNRVEQLQNQSFELLMSRTKKLTRETIVGKISGGGEWWISAKEALELGLVDLIEEAPASNGQVPA